ncbi:hypothetical protein CBM2605_A240145 [Cupriavidus neocaledonicus]|uniref:Resolvase/invertase-type recombinase catalytic domain-containing protein n=1 Tax=Cupriavidus neocaledonicus TaxID=1040979 RepID=A0ABY1V0E3_9BURK|nr:hypothetical protein CBM2605_A240145 [Cupriavidus neocaledonicus]
MLKQDKGLGPNGERKVVCYSTSQLPRKFDARGMETIRRFSRAVTIILTVEINEHEEIASGAGSAWRICWGGAGPIERDPVRCGRCQHRIREQHVQRHAVGRQRPGSRAG